MPATMFNKKLALLVLFTVFAPALAADPAVFRFEDAGTEARFQAITKELRCLVCQNQSLADSHAELAGDLRREVHEMIKAGKEDRGIVEFLVRRYGDFVLYRPPLDPRTAALWLGPIGLLPARGPRRVHRAPPAGGDAATGSGRGGTGAHPGALAKRAGERRDRDPEP